jgi:hypothetical protein
MMLVGCRLVGCLRVLERLFGPGGLLGVLYGFNDEEGFSSR